MTDKLPSNLLALFAPRPPLRFLPPTDHHPTERHTADISGVAQYLAALKLYKEEDTSVPTESWLQRRERKRSEKLEQSKKNLDEGVKTCERALNP